MTCFFFFFQAEDGIRDATVTGVQTCALPISHHQRRAGGPIRDADGAPAPPFPGLRRWRCARAAQGTLERAARCSPGSIRTAGAASLPPAVANGPPAPFYLCASACSTHPLDVLPKYSPALARQLPELR